MKNLSILTLILGLLFSPACNNKPESVAEVEIVNGIEFIHNSETPLFPERTVTFVEELSIGSEDQEGNINFYDPGNFVVDQAENIYLADEQDQTIKIFDPQGKYIRSIGTKGQGPGEFERIGYMAFLPDERLLVQDYQNRRTSVISRTGEFEKSHPWINSYSFILAVTNNSYLTSYMNRVEGETFSESKRVLTEFDFNGKELRSFGAFKMPEMKMLQMGDVIFGMSVPHSPHSNFAAALPFPYFYHNQIDQYKLDVYDLEGNVLRQFDRPYKPLPYTKADKEKFLERYKNSRNERFKKLGQEMPFPSHKAVVAGLIVDDKENLWVALHEEKEKNGLVYTAYDIFNKEGYYEAKVWSDITPTLFVKGKMYRVDEDEETGYSYLKRYKVVWN